MFMAKCSRVYYLSGKLESQSTEDAEAPLPVTELQRYKGSIHAIPKVPDTDPLRP
jgi:hypothetical protein